MEEEDDLLALGRDVPRQLDDPLLLVVLKIQGAAIGDRQEDYEGKRMAISGWQLGGGKQFMGIGKLCLRESILAHQIAFLPPHER